MKRLLYFAAIIAMGAACTKAETSDRRAVSGEDVTIFSGTLAPASKISIGEKTGDTYKAFWEDGDALTVINAADDSEIGTATLTEGAGSASGTFEYPGTIADGTSVRLVYGSDGVATDQAQAGAGASSFKDYAYAKSAAVTVSGGHAPAATLTHETAIVKVSVSAGSALQGATVSKVIIRSIGTVLSGTDKDYVQVSLATPVVLSGELQDIWAVSAPCDATGKEVDIALVITKDDETYTLPVGFAGTSIQANKVSYFPLSGITDADCVGWYEPHDARLMPVVGYGYGAANCYLIQYKGATYNGATLSPDANIPASVDIDFRARGDFLKVDKPEGVTFEWVKKLGTSTIYNIQTGGYTACNENSFSIAPNASAYTVKITNTGAYAGAPILSMKKDGKVIWAWTLWNVSADGTRLGSTDVAAGEKTYKLANMDIGQNTTQFETWVANKNTNGNPDVIFRTNLYYQWGRPTPIYWSSWPTNNFTTASGFNISLVQGPVSVEEALSYPGMSILTSEGYESGKTTSNEMKNWHSENYGALWGGNMKSNQTAEGEKSIYDPCPKGWRVADPAVYNAMAGTITAVKTTAGAYYTYSSLSPDNHLSIPGRYVDKLATNGRIATEGMANSGTSATQGTRWTNFAGGNGGVQARAYLQDGNTVSNCRTATYNKACAMSVRCIVDEENR